MPVDFFDLYFAKTVLKEAYTEELGQFLARLMEASREGHLCLVDPSAPLLPKEVDQIVVKEGDRYYLARQWTYEKHVERHIDRLKKQIPSPLFDETRFEEGLLEMSLTLQQEKAIRSVFHQTLTIICGGPGTGKSYSAACLVRLLKNSSLNPIEIKIAAPTGKAAAHLQSILQTAGISVEATTLHHLLRLYPGADRLGEVAKIEADLLIVDEASMIDAPLFAHLLEAINDKSRLVLLGDPNQLPPIGMGNFFSDLSELPFAIVLGGSKRTRDLALQELAQKIHEGVLDEISVPHFPWKEKMAETLYEKLPPMIFKEAPDLKEVYAAWQEIRVLCPLRQGPNGIDALNQELFRKVESNLTPGAFYALPILITKNEASLAVYNGTFGIWTGQFRGSLTRDQGSLYIPPHTFASSILPHVEGAFCLSIHKAQGGEFKQVIALFPPGSEQFGREAVYTAVTRAKEKLEIWGGVEVLREMVKNRSRKISGLSLSAES